MAKCKLQLPTTRASSVHVLLPVASEAFGMDHFPSNQVRKVVWMMAWFVLYRTFTNVKQLHTV